MEFTLDEESLRQLRDGSGVWKNIQPVFRETFASMLENQAVLVGELNEAFEKIDHLQKHLNKVPTKSQMLDLAGSFEGDLSKVGNCLKDEIETNQLEVQSNVNELRFFFEILHFIF